MRHFESPAELATEMERPDGFRFLPSFGPATFRCADCGEAVPLNMTGSGGSGYATDSDRTRFTCYPCAGERESAFLVEHGRGMLYLCRDVPAGEPARQYRTAGTMESGYYLTDWPGTFRLPVSYGRIGRHNMAGRRFDVRFTGPDGREWRGTSYGDNTQICHVRRLKSRYLS